MAQGHARVDADKIMGACETKVVGWGWGVDLFTAAVCCQHRIVAFTATSLVSCSSRQTDKVMNRQQGP